MQQHRLSFKAPIWTVALGLLNLAACNQQPATTVNSEQSSASVVSVKSIVERTRSQVDSPKVYSPRVYSKAELERLRQIRKRMDATYVRSKYSGRSEIINGIKVNYAGAKTEEAFQKQRVLAREQIKNKRWLSGGDEAPSSITIGGDSPPVLTEEELRATSFEWSGLRGLRNIDSTLAVAETEEARRQAVEEKSLKIKQL